MKVALSGSSSPFVKLALSETLIRRSLCKWKFLWTNSN